MSPKQALEFVERHGVVLQAARGELPNLAEAVAGGPIRGSWWGHPKGRDIYHATEAICASRDVLVCKLVGGKVTYVHRRLWPALVRLAGRFRRAQLARVWNEHTSRGSHRSRTQSYPAWVPAEVIREAKGVSEQEAEALLAPALGHARPTRARDRRGRRPAQ